MECSLIYKYMSDFKIGRQRSGTGLLTDQEYDYRPNSTRSPFTNFKIVTITKFEKKPSVKYFGAYKFQLSLSLIEMPNDGTV